MDFILENCVDCLASCVEAERGGASRIELCAALAVGGITPSKGFVEQALQAVSIPVFPIIRPRGGDFLYTEEEVRMMETDIRQFVSLGVKGVVIGALTADGRVDVSACRRLREAAGEASVTFHRAFDVVRCPAEALAGVEQLSRLVRQAAGRISIMPGCGVTEENVAEIARRTGARELHASLRSPRESGMTYRHPGVSFSADGDYLYPVTDAHKVRQAVSALKSLG